MYVSSIFKNATFLYRILMTDSTRDLQQMFLATAIKMENNGSLISIIKYFNNEESLSDNLPLPPFPSPFAIDNN